VELGGAVAPDVGARIGGARPRRDLADRALGQELLLAEHHVQRRQRRPVDGHGAIVAHPGRRR
jgi:hypothetical protein